MGLKKWCKGVVSRLGVVRELFHFLWENKLWWMVPIIVIFVLLGVLIWLAQSAAVVPFVYTLF